MEATHIKIKHNDKTWLTIIGILGVVVPLLVAVLLFMPQTGALGDFNVSFLPGLNAVLNSATALALIIGYVYVKNGNRDAHRTAMLVAFTLSSIFLISYVVYHFQAAHTKYGDANHDGIVSDIELATAGIWRSIYFVLLVTHIVLAAVIVPFVLLSIYFGLSNQVKRHRAISKFTFPMWLYVAITGVVVYAMISPYYP